MRRLTKPVVLLILAMLFSGSPMIAAALNGTNTKGLFNFISAPWLLEPAGDSVELKGKDFLEFKWKPDLSVNTDYYDFRLYKGYPMLASTLILKQRVNANESSFKVAAATFDNGRVYTWSLRRVILTGEKSDKSFSSFKVTKD
jgi:hypothetical protein